MNPRIVSASSQAGMVGGWARRSQADKKIIVDRQHQPDSMGFYNNYRKYNMTKQNDPFGFNKAINWDKLKDPKVLEELKKLFDEEEKKEDE